VRSLFSIRASQELIRKMRPAEALPPLALNLIQSNCYVDEKRIATLKSC